MTKPGDAPWRLDAFVHLTFPELLRLKAALEGSEDMVTDTAVYHSVLACLWLYADRAEAWPGRTQEGRTYVYFCTEAQSPDDPNHQPEARLGFDPARMLKDVWYRCTCGVRDQDATSVARATGRRWRAPRTPAGWLRSDGPEAKALNVRDVEPGRLLVCPAVTSLDDRAHGHVRAYAGSPPGEGTTRALFLCVCGASTYDDEMQQIPVDKPVDS